MPAGPRRQHSRIQFSYCATVEPDRMARKEDAPNQLICMGLSNVRVGSAFASQLRRFLLELVWFYPIRLMNWFRSK